MENRVKFSEATRKHLDGRFSEFEMFQMFNIDCDPNIDAREVRVRYIEEPYSFNDIRCPLLVLHKRTKRVGRRKFHDTDADQIKDGITNEPPGSKGRIEALRRHYATSEESAFKV